MRIDETSALSAKTVPKGDCYSAGERRWLEYGQRLRARLFGLWLWSLTFLVETRDAMIPKEDHNGESRLTLDEIVEWRNRMKEALGVLGTARYLWISDSLGLPRFDGGDGSVFGT